MKEEIAEAAKRLLREVNEQVRTSRELLGQDAPPAPLEVAPVAARPAARADEVLFEITDSASRPEG